MADPATAARAAAWAVQQVGAADWNNYCQLFVEQAYGTRGQFASALAAGNALPLTKALDKARPGQLVLFSADDTNNGHGHAAIYVGNGEMVSATPTGVKREKILENPYWRDRFRGVADAPAEWQGRTSTPELERGAQALIAQATGGTTMATTPKSNTIKHWQDEAAAAEAELARLSVDRDAARARIVGPPPPPNTPARERWEEAKNEVLDWADPDSPQGKSFAKAQSRLSTARERLADAQDDATAAPGERAPTTVSTSANEPYIVRQDAQGNLSFLPNPNYKAPAAQRRTQVVGQNLIDLDTGAVIAQLPAATQNKRTQVVGTKLIDLDTGAAIADLTEALAKPEAPAQPQGVSTPTGQQFIVRRLPDGTLERTPNPNYVAPAPPALPDAGAQYQQEATRRQALARAERDRLLQLQRDGALTPDQAQEQFEAYWQREVESPLAGLRTMAERQRSAAVEAQAAAQRAEDQRAEGINRQREQTAYQAGQSMRTAAASLAPGVRSAAFLDKYAQSINAYSGKTPAPTWSASDFRPDPGQIPNLDALAAEETARALAHISPAAAARVGAPIPDLAALPDINTFLPPFRLPAQGA